MFASHVISLFALNVAIASLLCTSLALIISACFGSLPKRYATLVVGLIACSLSPLVVALGTACSLGRLPAIVTTEDTINSRAALETDIAMDEPEFIPASAEQLISQSPDVTHHSTAASPVVIPMQESAALPPAAPPNPSSILASLSWPSLSSSLLAVWLLGSLFMLGWYLRKLWLCHRFLAACQPVTDSRVQSLFAAVAHRIGTHDSIRLLQSASLPTPVVIALGRPVVIVPADIQMSLSSDQLTSVFAHELSHIARKDHWAAALQTLTRILYWWNPLVHWVSRRANELREMICDDIATSVDIAPREYAKTIIQMAERTAATREFVGSLGISLSPVSELERRLRRIIAEKSHAVDLRISKRFLIGIYAFSAAIVTGLLFAQVPQVVEKALAATEQVPSTEPPAPETKAERKVIVRGQVTHPDGTPAPNMSVHVIGVSYERITYERSTTTDLDGRYQLPVLPNQICALYVKDSVWTESELTGFAVTNQKSIERDLHLRHVTRLHGQILDTVNNEGVPDQPFVLTRRGIDWQALAKDTLPNPGTMPLWTYPIQSISAVSDKDGNYEFWVGDGDYQLTTRGEGGFQEVKVRGETEVIADTTIKLIPRIEFAAQIVDSAGRAVSEAKILSSPVNFESNPSRRDDRLPSKSRDWSMVSDQNGWFKTKRFAEAQILQVTSPDKALRALVKLQPYETTKDIRLGHTGAVHGRLMNEEGSAPAVAQRITCGIRMIDEETRMITWRFGSATQTDDDGNFRFENLYPFWEYEIYFTDIQWHIMEVTKFTPLPSRDLDMGHLSIPSPPKPYTPPTMDQRIDAAFNSSGTAAQRFERASKLIGAANQNLLILFCYQSDPRARSLMATRISSAFDPYRDDFRVLPIVTSNTYLEEAKAIASKFDIDLSGGHEAFHALLLNAASGLIASLDASQLCDGDQFSQKKLFSLLDQNRIKLLNAKGLLDEALLRAARENKKVLIQQTAPRSTPSQSLSLLLTNTSEWKKDYVWVQIDDRWIGAKELMNTLKKGSEGSVPWYAILDSSGHTLVTSHDPVTDENIGYPMTTRGYEHFIDMFKSTSVHMSDADLKHLRFNARNYANMSELR